MPDPTQDLLLQIRDIVLKSAAESLRVPQIVNEQEQRLGQILIDNSGRVGQMIGGPVGATVVIAGEVARGLQEILGTAPAITKQAISTTPVLLPSPAPPEYHAYTPTEIWAGANSVYDPYMGPLSFVRDDLLIEAVEAGWTQAYTNGLRPFACHDFSLISDRPEFAAIAMREGWNGDPIPWPTSVDWSTWIPGDSLVAFLNQQMPTWTWSYWSDSNGISPVAVAWVQTGEQFILFWRCNVADWELPWRSGKWATQLAESNPRPLAYPGPDGVTFATGVAITPSLFVEAAMHGCVVNVVDWPTRITPWTFGGKLSIRGLGFASFVSEDGYAEPQQKVMCPTSLLTPTAMVKAGGCAFQFMSGVTGTVTPYTIDGAP